MTKKRITSPQVQESGTDKQDEIRQSVGPIILLAMSGKDSGKKAKNVKKGTKEKVQKTLSHNDVLAQKFSELTPEKKREYMCIVRGTIRGTTGFFDTRFTAGISDFKSSKVGGSKTADAIIHNSGSYSDEGGGSENSNNIVVLMGDQIFSSESKNFYDSSKKIDRGYLNYKKILSCKFDKTQNAFIVKVECADGSVKEIQATYGRKYEFEEELLGKLRVPVELLQKDDTQQQKELQVEIDKENKEIAEKNMYQRALNIFILEGNREEAERYMKKEGVRLSDNQRDQYIEHLLEGWKRGYGRGMTDDDMKTLLQILEGISDAGYVRAICERMLEKSIGWRDVDTMIEQTIAIGGIDPKEYFHKKLDRIIEHRFGYDDVFKEIDALIEKHDEDPKKRYQKILEKSYEESVIGYSKEYAEKIITQIAKVLGREYDEVYKEIFIKNMENEKDIRYHDLKKIFDVIESRGYEKDLYNKVFDKVCANENIRKDRYYSEKVEIVTMLGKIKKYIGRKFPEAFFECLIDICATPQDHQKQKEIYPKIRQENIIDYSSAEQERILDMMADKYVQGKTHYKASDLINRGLKDPQKILNMIEYLLDKRHDFGESDEILKILDEKNIMDEKLKEQIDEIYAKVSTLYCGGKKLESNRRCDEVFEQYAKYADKESLEKYVQFKIQQYNGINKSRGDYDFFFTHIANCMVNGGFDQQYIQDVIMKHIDKGDYALSAKYIKGFGLKIDKVRVNALVKTLFEQGKIKEAETIAHNGGLYDVRKKKLTVKKLESKMMDAYDTKRAIEYSGLDESYYRYVIEMELDRGRFKDALEIAENHSIIISDEQFDRYLGRNERLRKADEERKLKEHYEREEKAVEMMKVVLEGKISCDIEYKKDQKYVLIRNLETGLQIASRDLERHKDIVAQVGADKRYVVGGGRLSIDEKNKTLKIYGSSGDFWKVAEEYNEVMMHIIKQQYPDYSIHIE